MATVNDDLLAQVRRALDEIDQVPISATGRRTARIASMLGETEFAVRLGLELKTLGGHPPTNAEETRRLMADPSMWALGDGPIERALETYIRHRQRADDANIMAHGLDEIAMWLEVHERERFDDPEWITATVQMRSIQDRVRHSCFTALCEWERRLTYANTNEQVFERFRADVDRLLAQGAPHLLDQFNAVYRRLRDVAVNPEAEGGEELSQAITTCRRILKAVADHILPGERRAASDDGHSLDDQAYRNRVFEFVKQNVTSERSADVVQSAVGGLVERFNSLDQLASKGVHADMALPEAELCAINTYIVAGELLRIASHLE